MPDLFARYDPLSQCMFCPSGTHLVLAGSIKPIPVFDVFRMPTQSEYPPSSLTMRSWRLYRLLPINGHHSNVDERRLGSFLYDCLCNTLNHMQHLL